MGKLPVDHGWAWMVCLGSFISMFMVQGTVKTMGVLYVEVLEEYHSQQGITALMLGLTAGLMSLISPLTMLVAIRCTFRSVVMFGGVCMFVGAVATAWAPNSYVCIIVFGSLTGIGCSCLLGPTVAILNQYFHKRVAFAMGLVTAGGSLGQLVLPILLTYLAKEHSLKGTLLIYGALSLHVLIAGALMRPASYYERPSRTFRHSKDSKDIEDARELENVTPAKKNTDMAKPSTSGSELPPETSGSKDKKGKPLLRFDIALLKEPLFVAYVFTVAFGSVGFYGFYHFLPDFARDLDISKERVALVLSLAGIMDCFGHVVGCWLGDRQIIKRSKMGAVLSAVMGVAVLFGTVFPTFWNVLMMGLVMGLGGGVTASVFPVILRDWLGARRYAGAYGLAMILRGACLVPSPVLLGKLRETSGSYQASFWICSLFLLLSAIAYMSESFSRRCIGRRHPSVEIVREITVTRKT